jgi:elongation factor Ts
VRKFYEDVVLTEQFFVMDPEKKVSAILAAAGKEAGAPIEVAGFVRFQMGEGLEKKQEDFAQAVADQLKR